MLNQAVRDSMQAFYANCRDDETLSELEIEDEDDEYPDEDDTFSEDESDVPDFFNGITF